MNGTIYPRTIAKATWLIMALTEAAPIFETKYDVSGILKYSIEGVEYIQVSQICINSYFIHIGPLPLSHSPAYIG